MPVDGVLRLGTRGSDLARWQADHVIERLAASRPGVACERVIVRTAGDKILDTALSKIGDKGLFTKALEEALRERRIDVAVHSLKDLPTAVPDDLTIAAILEREDPRDALVSVPPRRLAELPAGSRVGTSSLRRRAQILAIRGDLRVEDLRGNVPTRLERVRRGDYDAAVLARAGLVRLGLDAGIVEVLDASVMLPAVGQGAIAVESRADDARSRAIVASLDHMPTRLVTAAERALLARLEGGCQIPVGALAVFEGSRLTLRGVVADLDGRNVVRAVETAAAENETDARGLGERVADRLLDGGARPILDALRAPEARASAIPSVAGAS